MLKYERGRVQTDGEYKLLILLTYLSRTIEWETIKNHMHHAGSHPNPNRIWVSHLPWPDCSKPSILGLGQSQYLGGLRSLPMSLPSIVQAGRPPTRSVLKYNMFASNVLRIWHRWCRTIAWPWSHGALDKWQISPTSTGMHKYIGCQTCDKRKQCSHP